MPPDPNWFYSTLAQSNAAIVGLAGGFLVQRVVAQRGDLGIERSDLRRNLEAFQERIDQQRPAIAQVFNSMNEQLAVVAAAKEDGHPDVVLHGGSSPPLRTRGATRAMGRSDTVSRTRRSCSGVQGMPPMRSWRCCQLGWTN